MPIWRGDGGDSLTCAVFNEFSFVPGEGRARIVLRLFASGGDGGCIQRLRPRRDPLESTEI